MSPLGTSAARSTRRSGSRATDISATIRRLGVDNVTFETDFLHPVCLYPKPLEMVRECLADLTFEGGQGPERQRGARLRHRAVLKRRDGPTPRPRCFSPDDAELAVADAAAAFARDAMPITRLQWSGRDRPTPTRRC